MAQVTILNGYIKVVGKPVEEIKTNPIPVAVVKTSVGKSYKSSGKCCGK